MARVELLDENDVPTTFEHLMTFEYEGERFIALTDINDDPENMEITLMQVFEDEHGTDTYHIIEDGIKAQAIFTYFVELYEEDE